MSDDGESTLEVKGLDKLIKLMGQKPPVAKVGILGSKAGREAKNTQGPNNAEIGAHHEFGTDELPVRSFLRMPISEYLSKRMEKAGALDKDVLGDTIKSGTLLPYMKKIAILAESIVLEAFGTGGFGKWKPSNMSEKKNHQTLVETQQLRNSITHEVKS